MKENYRAWGVVKYKLILGLGKKYWNKKADFKKINGANDDVWRGTNVVEKLI